MLHESTEIGRALTADEEARIMAACRVSRSRSLYPAVLVSTHTAVRNKELRLLRWHQIDLIGRSLTVGTSKTEGGTGRVVPLNDAATQCLKEWRAQFPEAKPSHFVFPSERYGFDGEKGHLQGAVVRYNVRPSVPIGSWKVAWTNARTSAGVKCRWHDLRHTFVSKLAEGMVSDTTITSIAGWMSKKMMERYSHSSNEAKRRAVAILDRIPEPEIQGSPQTPHSRSRRLHATYIK